MHHLLATFLIISVVCAGVAHAALVPTPAPPQRPAASKSCPISALQVSWCDTQWLNCLATASPNVCDCAKQARTCYESRPLGWSKPGRDCNCLNNKATDAGAQWQKKCTALTPGTNCCACSPCASCNCNSCNSRFKSCMANAEKPQDKCNCFRNLRDCYQAWNTELSTESCLCDATVNATTSAISYSPTPTIGTSFRESCMSIQDATGSPLCPTCVCEPCEACSCRKNNCLFDYNACIAAGTATCTCMSRLSQCLNFVSPAGEPPCSLCNSQGTQPTQLGKWFIDFCSRANATCNCKICQNTAPPPTPVVNVPPTPQPTPPPRPDAGTSCPIPTVQVAWCDAQWLNCLAVSSPNLCACATQARTCYESYPLGWGKPGRDCNCLNSKATDAGIIWQNKCAALTQGTNCCACKPCEPCTCNSCSADFKRCMASAELPQEKCVCYRSLRNCYHDWNAEFATKSCLCAATVNATTNAVTFTPTPTIGLAFRDDCMSIKDPTGSSLCGCDCEACEPCSCRRQDCLRGFNRCINAGTARCTCMNRLSTCLNVVSPAGEPPCRLCNEQNTRPTALGTWFINFCNTSNTKNTGLSAPCNCKICDAPPPTPLPTPRPPCTTCSCQLDVCKGAYLTCIQTNSQDCSCETAYKKCMTLNAGETNQIKCFCNPKVQKVSTWYDDQCKSHVVPGKSCCCSSNTVTPVPTPAAS